MKRGVLRGLGRLLLVGACACAFVGLLPAAVAAVLRGDVLNVMRSAYCVTGAAGLLLAALLLMAGRSREKMEDSPRYRERFGPLPVVPAVIAISAALLGCGGVLDYLVR